MAALMIGHHFLISARLADALCALAQTAGIT
jgi:hypothetical protein